MNVVARALQPLVDAAWSMGARPTAIASDRPSVPSVPLAAASPENPQTNLSTAASWLYEALGAAQSDAGVAVSERSAMTVTALYRAVALISSTNATCGLEVGRIESTRTGPHFVPEPNHPVQAILREPHPIFTDYMFVEGATERVLVHGNSYVAINWKNSMRPEKLTPLQPEHVQDVRRVGDRLKYLVEYTDESGYNDRKRREIIDQDFMLHFAGPGFNGVMSPSPIRYAGREALGLALATQSYQSRYLTAGARPSGVLALDKGISPEDFQRVKAQWRESYSGLSKAGQTAVLPAGATYSPISFSHADAEILATRRFSVAELGRLYGVPLFLLGETEKSTSWGTGLVEQTASLIRFTLNSWMKRIAGELTRKLLWQSERPAYIIRFNRDELMRGVGPQLAQYIETLVAKAAVISPNEGRRELGYGPTDDPADDRLRQPTGAPAQIDPSEPDAEGGDTPPADAPNSQPEDEETDQ